MGAYSFEMVAPAEKSAISIPWADAGVSASTVNVCPATVNFLPVDRSDASALIDAAGNFHSTNSLNISWPTAPVAPTTATWNFLEFMVPIVAKGKIIENPLENSDKSVIHSYTDWGISETAI
jgi:hypothetical protein